MKQPSHEDLLGFVLGALDAQEQTAIEQLIDQDPQIEEELLRIRTAILPLDDLDCGGPRPGLARRTCELIAGLEKTAIKQSSSQEVRSSMYEAAIAAADPELIRSSELEDSRVQPAKPVYEAPQKTSRSFSLTDLLAAAAMLAIVAGILFPTISYTRFNSRVIACQDNLRQIGNAMIQYSDINEGSFIAIPESGNLAVSGCYAPILKDAGLIENDEIFGCAGVGSKAPIRIPGCGQVTSNDLSKEQVLHFQKIMGGHFGYAMGYCEGNLYCVPKNMGRSNIVLLADQPSIDLEGRKSANHGGKGQNCLFEDGRVEFVVGHVYGNDALFENDYGVVAPGSNAWDNVIAPSHLALPVDVLFEPADK
ncbi:MAG: hypothetical protein AAF623_01365 [Planctomycetota bacterium]